MSGLADVSGPMSPATRDVLLELRELAATWLHALELDARRLPVGAESMNNATVRDALGHLMDDLRAPLGRGGRR